MKKRQKILTRNTYDTRRWQLGERPYRLLGDEHFLVMHDHLEK